MCVAYIAMSQPCMFRKSFDTRHSLIGRDHVDIDKLVQASATTTKSAERWLQLRCVVLEGICMHVTNLYFMHVLITLSCIDGRATT